VKDYLKTLKLTPGVIGAAQLADGSLVFPITGFGAERPQWPNADQG
jgi:hypothetical protein